MTKQAIVCAVRRGQKVAKEEGDTAGQGTYLFMDVPDLPQPIKRRLGPKFSQALLM